MPVGPGFHEALAYASELHAAQVRKGSGIPYVAHLLAVASIVLEAGGTQDEATAAVLHDAAEDQGGEATLAEIGRRFGDNVRTIVAACSDTFETVKPEWRERKERYLAHLREADTSTLLVSAADKLHNATATLRDLTSGDPNEVWSRFKGGREGTLWYYRELVRAYDEAPAADDRVKGIVAQLRPVVEGFHEF